MATMKADVPRPPAALVLSTPVHLVAFGFGSGLAPVAPGTVGTLAAVPLVLILGLLPLSAYLLIVAVLFIVGCVVCAESARRLGVADYPGFVFDEFVGFFITCIPLVALGHPGSDWLQAVWIAVAFLLFRLFDVAKPWPISVVDREVDGGLGIMLDDALAGVAAAVSLGLGLHLFT